MSFAWSEGRSIPPDGGKQAEACSSHMVRGLITCVVVCGGVSGPGGSEPVHRGPSRVQVHLGSAPKAPDPCEFSGGCAQKVVPSLLRNQMISLA